MAKDGGGASRTTDPAQGTSAATDVSLREYITQRFDNAERVSGERLARLEQRLKGIEDLAQERLLGTRRELHDAFEASEKAIEKAEHATEKRFESVNEFRAQLSDQTATFARREVIEPRLDLLEKFQSKMLGALAIVAVAVPLATSLIVYLITKGGG